VLLGAAAPSWAGPIVVSGDINIINDIGTLAGNQAFFLNLLGGGDTVVIRSGNAVSNNNTLLEGFYDGQAGVSASQVASVTAASLTGADLFIGLTSSVAYSAAEQASLQAFSAAGGRVMLFGENAHFPVENANVNALTAFLGSALSLGGPTLDAGFHQATGAQITAHPLASGIASFQYAAYSAVSGGQPVFFGTDLNTAIIAAENFAAVPEPAGLALVGLGAVMMRRRQRRVRRASDARIH
jgi:hypothetical protein